MRTTARTTVGCDRRELLNRVAPAMTGIPRCGNCHADLPWTVNADNWTFIDLAERSTPLVPVDLHAPWSGPCRVVSRALERIAHEYAEKLKLVSMLRRGEIVARRSGALPVPALRQRLQSALHATTGRST
jgi:thioredoxin 2